MLEDGVPLHGDAAIEAAACRLKTIGLTWSDYDAMMLAAKGLVRSAAKLQVRRRFAVSGTVACHAHYML
jgi:hypothetical protein